MRVSRVAVAVAVAAVVASAARAGESPYFPLQEGWHWEFVGDGGDQAVSWVAGVQEVQGVQTTVLHWQFSGDTNEYLEQYYTVADDGTVLIHRFWNREAELMRSFDPPVILLPASLGPDASWCTTVQDYYDLEGTLPAGDPFELCFRVYAVEDVHVPAGDFTAFGVEQFLPNASSAPARDALGRLVSRLGEYATDWYAVGVGEVILSIYQRFELASYSQPPTPARSTTWGAIKRPFLPNRALQQPAVAPRGSHQ